MTDTSFTGRGTTRLQYVTPCLVMLGLYDTAATIDGWCPECGGADPTCAVCYAVGS